MNRPPYLVCVSPRNPCQRSPCAARSLRHPVVGRQDRRRDAHRSSTQHSILRNRCRESDPCRDSSALDICRLSIFGGVDFRRSRISAVQHLWELRQERQARCPCFDPSRDWADASRATCPSLGMRTWRPHDTSPQHHCGVHTIWRSWSRAPLWTVWLVNVFDIKRCLLIFPLVCFLALVPFLWSWVPDISRSIWVVKKVHFLFGFDMSASISLIIHMGFETGLFFFPFVCFRGRVVALTFFSSSKTCIVPQSYVLYITSSFFFLMNEQGSYVRW